MRFLIGYCTALIPFIQAIGKGCVQKKGRVGDCHWAPKLWLPSPAQMKIPLVCGELDWEDLLLSPWGWYDPLTRLDQLVVPLRPGEYSGGPDALHRVIPHPGQTVALATLIEYAVAAYGREQLPMLVTSLRQYDSWETLIPAVYGVSVAEFEAGWQAYLAAHYGVPKR